MKRELESAGLAKREELADHSSGREGETADSKPLGLGSFYSRFGKRFLDLCLATPALVVLTPFLGLCAILIKASSPGPVFFRQKRVGLDGRPFTIFKFRTMVVRPQAQGMPITASGDPRVTGVGALLRRSKIDELPQLYNVFRGEMSFVGPRPEIPLYVEKYTPEQQRILWVKPGITNLAAIAYRDEERVLAASPDPEEMYRTVILPRKLELDLMYIDRVSFLYDLKLILKTVGLLTFPGLFKQAAPR